MNAQAQELSGELATELEANGRGYLQKVGDLVVDPDTGEIVEFPDKLQTAPDRLEWLTHQILEAAGEAKKWEAVAAFKRSVAEKLLAEMDVPSFSNAHGRISYQAGYAKARIERLPQVQVAYELSEGDVRLIFMQCASALDAKRVEVLAQARPDLRAALLALIEPTKGFVKVTASRKQAPEIERVTR